MKHIKFKKIKISNFLSIGKDPVEIDFRKGLHIITGVNKDKEDSKNGVGKSTVNDAIFFALFGETLRPIKKEGIINNTTKKGCVVQIEFDVINDSVTTEYKVVRTITPSTIRLFINGEDKTRTVPKTNASIIEALGTNSEMFKNSVVMCLNSTEPFLAQKGVAKRKFIEGIFSLSIFSEMQKLIKEDLNSTKSLYELEKTKIDEIQKNIDVYISQQKDQQTRKEKAIAELLDRKLRNAKEREDATEQIVKIDIEKEQAIKEKIELLEGEEVRLTDKSQTFAINVATKKSEIKSIKQKITEIEQLGNACITCKRPFSDVDFKQREEKIKEYTEEIDTFSKEVISFEEQITEIQGIKKQCKEGIAKLLSKQEEFKLLKQKNRDLLYRIDQLNIWAKQIDNDIEEAKNETVSFENVINETKTRLESLNVKLDNLKKNLKIYEAAKFVTSDEGVKSFIVNKMLKLLNTRLSYYLHKLDANAICIFNEYFEETMKNEKGQDCSYFNFSSGEQKRIDLAMLFTFTDIRKLQSTVSVNIAVYDELLDSSLDAKGISDVLEVLKEQIDAQEKAIYIISHKSEAIKHATGDIIFLEKENGNTRRTEYVIEVQE
jgi:DNA repair exonuclease SbcCD ATPase subunit